MQGFPQQILNLRIQRSELRPGPALQGIVQRRVEAEEERLPLGQL